MKLKKIVVRMSTASKVAILLVALSLAFVTGGCSVLGNTSPPSAQQQSEEVTALQTHVLPVVKELKATWYLSEISGDSEIYWKGGKFTKNISRSREEGAALFNKETEAAFERFAQAIQTSGVPTNRLVEAKFADDGTLSFASFQRRGGGITYVFTYIYSPRTKPPEWKSKLGPVVLTRIGDSDWWFEQSPDD